jgi:Replication initiator protein A
MSDEDKDARRIGRDEMNVCEFPIAILADYPPAGVKMLVFEDSHGKLTVVGSEDLGLPTAPDADVIVALLHLTKIRNDFTDPTVHFSRYELVDLLGWADNGQNYRRLDESLHRWVGVTLRYDGCWWDNSIKCRVDASFHIIDRVVIHDREVRHELQARQQPPPLSNFTWGKDFFASCQANYLKRLDLGIYFELKSAVSKQMYRFLDKKFHIRRDWTFDLREFALEHIGLARTYSDAGKLKAKLQPALEELEAIGFLEPMSPAARYTKTGRGAWNIRVVRKLPPPAEAQPPEPEPTGLERELVARGVTGSVAAELVRDFPEDRIRRQVEIVDWLRETKPKRIKDLGAYLAKAIREDYAAPAGFEGRAERAAREAADRAAHDREVAARQSKARAQEERDRVRAYWEALSPERRAALDAEALASADPADRAAHAAATAPPVRRMLQAGLRDAHIRRLLGLPAAD